MHRVVCPGMDERLDEVTRPMVPAFLTLRDGAAYRTR